MRVVLEIKKKMPTSRLEKNEEEMEKPTSAWEWNPGSLIWTVSAHTAETTELQCLCVMAQNKFKKQLEVGVIR